MNLFTTMDELLRDRASLYRTAREGGNLRLLSRRLLLLFLFSAALYGAVMGAFRSFHPTYFFSDFALSMPNGTPVEGDVAGIAPERHAIYTRTSLPPFTPGMLVRFNRTDPSEAYAVQAIGDEKGYHKIALTPSAVLSERDSWLLPGLVALKIPLLFLLTLLVCALALYIFNLAIGMRLHFGPTMLLMLFALAGTGVLLVVFTPIALLFTVVTSSYHFMKIMHVVIFIVAGLFGVKILGEGLAAMQEPLGEDPPTPVETSSLPSPLPLTQRNFTPTGIPRNSGNANKVRLVLFAWLQLYCLVGAQLAWTLKPFLGTPYLPATPPFRLEQGNIFVSTLESLQGMHAPDRDEQ